MAELSCRFWVDASGFHWCISLRPSCDRDVRNAFQVPGIEVIVELEEEDQKSSQSK